MSDCTCIRGDDGQVKVPRSRCPQHGWADTPTPAPALTDEQIGAYTGWLVYAAIPDGEALLEFNTWYAAVIARAKREAAEEIAQAIDRLHDTVYQARRVPELDPLRVDTACEAYRDGAAIARRIGATR